MAACTWLYPMREESPVGTTLIEGIDVFSCVTGNASASSTASAGMPYSHGWRHRRSPHAAKRAERCSPECAQGSASLSTRGPSLASTAGSNVNVAASTKMTASMMPRLIERNAGLGTSITAVSEMRTVSPENRTAFPAVSIVTAVASCALSLDPKKAPRKRMTMNSA